MRFRWMKCSWVSVVVQVGLRVETVKGEIPRPAGENAGLRDDARGAQSLKDFKSNHYLGCPEGTLFYGFSDFLVVTASGLGGDRFDGDGSNCRGFVGGI